MTADVVLRVEGISKKHCTDLRRSLRYGLQDIASEFGYRSGPGLRAEEFWALDDVSFELGRGEALAVVGDNGAGKSTLLKVLHGLLKPDAGTVRFEGSTEAFLELGTGLNPLLTGRENVALNAALRGLGQAESERLCETVAEFSELGPFMDASLQNYSSGMSARLSFALAASMAPDVMLVDEVLAVGDLAFQRKCVNHLRSYLAGGGSLVIVSHNVHQIQSICTQALLLDHGRVGFRGSAADTLNRMFENRIGVAPPAPQTQASQEPLTITNVSLEPLENDAIRTGRPLRIVLRYYAQEAVRATWGFNFWTADHWVCVTGDYQAHARVLDPGEGTLSCVVPRMPLEGGRYLLRAAVFADETRNMLALYGWEEPAPVHVLAAPGAISNVKQVVHQLVTMDVEWS